MTLPRPLVAIILAVSLFSNVLAQNLSASQIDAVRARLSDAAKQSWELGTRAEALLELDAPAFSVFSRYSLPPSPSIPSNTASAISPVFTIASSVVSARASSNGGITGPQPLINDSAAGDPASVGVAVLLADWTGQGGGDFAGAALDQLNYLYQSVPKTIDGAISHRVSEVQLWSDFVYMVPPFLAYYGVMTANSTLLFDAYNQINLYRTYLRDPQANNLWKHIILGSKIPPDNGHWSTGNGWAAAGMLRVLATIQGSQFAQLFRAEQSDLANWVQEIHIGMYSNLDSTNLFHNYADNSSTFYDASSSALLASTVYRLALIWGERSHLPVAEQVRTTLTSGNSSTNATTHITPDGWLTPVVNPDRFGSQGNQSAEGQAFVLEMQAAWRDWVADGSKGANGATLVGPGIGTWMKLCAAIVAGTVLAC